MTLLHRLASIVRWIVHRDQADRQLDAELQAYVDLSTAQKIREGLAPSEARRLAILELGGVEQAKERVRTERHGAGLDEIGRDVRYAFRMFAKYPGFTAVVIVTLALGIGANTAIFSLIDALVLRSLPVRAPGQLVQIQWRSPEDQQPDHSMSYAMVRAIAAQDEIFAGVTGFSGIRFNVGPAGAITSVPGALVTGGYYRTLGLNPAVGRLLVPDDDERGAPVVAVLSYGYWERQYARNPAAVGERLLVNGVPVSIVGVSPPGFVGANVGSMADITMPVAALDRVDPEAAPLLGTGNFWLRVLARPHEGLTMSAIEARLSASWGDISAPVIPTHWPQSRQKAIADAVFHVSPGATGWSYLREMYVTPLLVLMAVVALVLLIACANVASLLLARASARQREIALRLAIGAGRARIMRQLLIESTLLSCIGAAGGVALAWFSGQFLVSMIDNGSNQIVFNLAPNWQILGFTSAVAIATGVLFGLAPALHATANGPAAALRDDSRVSTSRSRLLPSLVSAQVALSLVLLVGAALFIRTLQNLQSFDPGFQPDGVLLVELEGRRTSIAQEVLHEIRRVPGVISASASTHTPLSGSIWSEPAVPAGQTVPDRDTAFFVGAGPEFFATMQIPLLAGREFTERDSRGAPGVVVVNQRYAERYFASQNPIGQHLSATVRGESRDLEVVGLVSNTSAAGLRAAPPPTVYVAYAQLTGDFPTTLEIRVTASLAQVAAAVREVLQRKLPNSLIEVRTLSAQVDNTMVRERMMATLAATFGLLALMLAAIGLYGLLAYSVERRTREIGIRMALGAQRIPMVALILQGAARLVIIGIAIGLPTAWAASRGIETMLFGVTPMDPSAVAGAIVALTITAQLAAYVPAWRASRVDPLTALRHE